MYCYVIIWQEEDLSDYFYRSVYWTDELIDAVNEWLEDTGKKDTTLIVSITKQV